MNITTTGTEAGDLNNRRHELKTDPAVFAAVLAGEKTHEIRKNDRGFAVGDDLLLRETTHTGAEIAAGAPLEYTGRTILCTVSHILTGYGLLDGWCILSIARRAAPATSPHAVGAVDEAWAANLLGLGGNLSSQNKERVACVLLGARASLAPVSAQQGAAEQPTAWLATDLDGRGDVGFTKEEAKRRAGEGCTEFFPLFDTAAKAPAAQAVARVERIVSTGGVAEVVVFLESALKVGTLLYASPASAPEAMTAPSAGAATTSNDARDAARLEKFIDWYLREGKRMEIDPFGHIRQTQRAHILRWLDGGSNANPENDAAMSAHQAKKTEGA
jgi:hypothetical protein